MKVTCSAAKIRAKFEVLGENHGPEILDLQKKMSNEEEIVLEHTRKVVAITDSCSSNEHPCTQQCAESNVNYNKLRRTCILVLLLCLIILMESVSAGI